MTNAAAAQYATAGFAAPLTLFYQAVATGCKNGAIWPGFETLLLPRSLRAVECVRLRKHLLTPESALSDSLGKRRQSAPRDMTKPDFIIPAPALAVLDRMPFNAEATHFYEHLSGGMVWSDEFPRGGPEFEILSEDGLDRFLIAARAAIMLGGLSASQCLLLWHQVEAGAPNWPGLRPERRSERMCKRLRAAKRLFSARYYEKFFAEHESGDAPPASENEPEYD